MIYDKMRKKGISPVVATVTLIAIVVVIAVIIFIWARGFLSEAAQKGDRAVEVSCGEVNIETQLIQSASNCMGGSAVDINNIGNIPIYGVEIFVWEDALGSLIKKEVFPDGTITIGNSKSVCLTQDITSGDAFRIIPKLLAEDSDGRRSVYTCPEKDGLTIAFSEF
jgi:flagellin-like protein